MKPSGKTILVVDDDDSIRRATMSLFRRTGHSFVEAKDGKEAVERYMENRPDLVICDYNMPVMNGPKAFEKILEYDQDARFIFVCGGVEPEKRDALIDMGALAVLTKPVDSAKFRAMVACFLGEPAGAPLAEPPMGAAAQKRIAVLFVDDNPTILHGYSEAAGLEGVSAQTAENGRDAIALFKQGGIDVVVTDLQMPEMDGKDLLRRIKALNQDAKVVILSCNGYDNRKELMDAGAAAVLSKPMGLGELFGQIRSIAQK